MARRNLILLLALLANLALPAVSSAQVPAPDSLSPEQVSAAALALSNRASADVRQLDLPIYKGDAGTLLAEGDSWFDYPFYDVLQNLKSVHQYRIESAAHKGDTLESMVYDVDQLSGLALEMARLRDLKIQPVAILLSGGGNDVSGPELALLLNHARSGLPTLNERIVSGVFDVRLKTSYLAFIQAVTNLSMTYFGKKVPVLVHGYDYPVPDGRGVLGGAWFLPGPWFKPFFAQKGYDGLVNNAATLRTLVDRFNSILENIPTLPGYAHVCYVRVVGTLSASLSEPGRYTRDWGNELHPTRSGFRTVAGKFHNSITTCAKGR